MRNQSHLKSAASRVFLMIALGVANPTDEAIAESIFRDVDHRKGGAMWEYISKGHLAVQIGKHGGVTENNFLVDPKTHTAKSANSGAWVKMLEVWKTAQLREIKIMPACKEDSCQMRGAMSSLTMLCRPIFRVRLGMVW
jgi:hypothetical protein